MNKTMMRVIRVKIKKLGLKASYLYWREMKEGILLNVTRN